MKTAQEIFDTIVNHLRHQNKPAKELMSCKYRTQDGRKCAVGCLISDEEYRPELEGLTIGSLLTPGSERYLPKLAKMLNTNQKESMAAEMQFIHDRTVVDDWEAGFKQAAKMFQLQYTSPSSP